MRNLLTHARRHPFSRLVARILILALLAAGIPVPLEASFGSRDPLLVTEDDLGNRLSQTDANGHATWFEYDALGRQTARILPDGSREEMAYDASGNLDTRTDFLGRTTTYA